MEQDKLIRLSKSVVGIEETKSLQRVIANGYLGMGDEVNRFERELKEFLQTDMEVICVNSGTAALHLALECMGFGAGDEVLVPSLTYVASYQAISATGALPISCDVTNDQGFIDLKDAELKITARTKAIMPVHYASNSMQMDSVHEFASTHQLRVVEDAAHSFGSSRNGAMVGAAGDVICFSFDGIKNITCGEGGAVVTSDIGLASKIRDARLLGVERDTDKRFAGERSWTFDVNAQGYRYHMSNLNAAIGRAQLSKAEYLFATRRAIAQKYLKELKGILGLEFFDMNYEEIVPHIFVVKVTNNKRDGLKEFLIGKNVESGIHYQPNHTLTYFKRGDYLPNVERLWNQVISLPLHPDVSEEDVIKIANLVRQYMKKIN